MTSKASERPAPLDLLMIAVIGAIMTYVWRVQDLFPVFRMIQLPTLSSLAAIGLYFLNADRRRALSRIRHPITYGLCAILLLACLSVPTSIHDGRSFRFIVDDLLKTFLMAMILAASVRTFADVRRYAAAMLIGATIYAAFVYVNVPVGQSGRLGNIVYYDANDLGMLLVSSIPLAIYFVVSARTPITKILAVGTLPIMLLMIIKTGSRGAFLGLLAMGLYFLIKFSAVKSAWRIGTVAAAVLFFSLMGSERYWEMMNTLTNPQQDYNWSGESETGRIEIWKRGIGYMLSRPVTGVGVAAFETAEGTISPHADRQSYGVGVRWASAHNSFVEIGAELGVLGLGLFMFLIYRAYRTSREEPRDVRNSMQRDRHMLGEALGGTVLGYAVTGFFLSQAFAAYSYFVYALIVGLAKTREPTQALRPAAKQYRGRRAATSIGAGA